MVWWEYVIIAAVLCIGIYAFLVLTRFETRVLSRRTSRTAESVYSNYGGSRREQRRYARQHGGERNDEGGHGLFRLWADPGSLGIRGGIAAVRGPAFVAEQ